MESIRKIAIGGATFCLVMATMLFGTYLMDDIIPELCAIGCIFGAIGGLFVIGVFVYGSEEDDEDEFEEIISKKNTIIVDEVTGNTYITDDEVVNGMKKILSDLCKEHESISLNEFIDSISEEELAD